ncbi:hypothetical protein [Lelliottia sp. RWM.1]|uniref:hypothetical protein n=1 Tax=Lelliottia sp. RWM.1 TaxID=2663242 RepID=UPI00193E7F69|nr:hypothetical protein [Lelliottia sp. RWM.1]MBM3071045.1 hypothetical protein [Lelliottia sp. RWM.1]
MLKSACKVVIAASLLINCHVVMAAGPVNLGLSALETLNKGLEFKEAIEEVEHHKKVAEMVSGIYTNATVYKLYDSIVGPYRNATPDILKQKEKVFYEEARKKSINLPDNIYLSYYGEKDYLVVMTKLTNADCKGFRAKLNNSDIQHLIINPGEKEPECKLFGDNIVAYVPKTFNPNYQ